MFTLHFFFFYRCWAYISLNWTQGYVLGNPFTDVIYDLNSRVIFAHRTALISDELYQVNCSLDFSYTSKVPERCTVHIEIICLRS